MRVSLKHKLRMWNKGQFNFWMVGLNYMRKRDEVMGKHLETTYRKLERERIVKIIETFIDENPISQEEEHTIRSIKYLLPFIKGEKE